MSASAVVGPRRSPTRPARSTGSATAGPSAGCCWWSSPRPGWPAGSRAPWGGRPPRPLELAACGAVADGVGSSGSRRPRRTAPRERGPRAWQVIRPALAWRPNAAPAGDPRGAGLVVSGRWPPGGAARRRRSTRPSGRAIRLVGAGLAWAPERQPRGHGSGTAAPYALRMGATARAAWSRNTYRRRGRHPVHTAPGMTMGSDPPCPGCSEMGRLVGYDGRRREAFTCRAPGCDVGEYDRDAIRRRRGLPPEPPVPTRPPRR